ncbi:MAG: response regulator [Lachnospiraceae bacterium]|nr:response regulator [Lachnospiraceae bacterium]
MKSLFHKYLSADYPLEKRLFNLALILSIAECLVIAVLSVMAKMDYTHTLLMLGGAWGSLVCLVAGEYVKRREFLNFSYFLVMYIMIIPAICYRSDMAICVFPCYLITGVVFTTVLMRGKIMWLILGIQLVVDIGCIYRAIVVKGVMQNEQMYTGTVVYIRVLSSIFLTGIVCGLLIAFRNRCLKKEIRISSEMEKEAEQQNYAKDMFMVNVSHEIRTPLNAILGTAELLLDLDTNDKVKESVFYISNSSKALLSITNDLMDFSKIDSESIQIEDREYDFREIFNDLINMFSVRFADCNVEVFIDIAPDIPERLYGDGAKIKQVILNQMTTLVKNMTNGKITLAISGEKRVEKEIWLKISVEAKGNFKYLNSANAEVKDSTIDNSVLHRGEQMCKTVVEAMGGRQEATKDGYRNNYYFEVPQYYETEVPLVEKSKYDHVKILLYENMEEQKEIFANVLNAMGIAFVRVNVNEVFYKECVKPEYTHILLAAERYEGMSEHLKELLEPQKLLLIKAGMFSYDDEMIKSTLVRPISCLSVDALLSGKKNYAVRDVDYNGRFECPDAKVLVVDDNVINLEVAGELLKKYKAQVFTAISGKECLNFLQEENVDFIFLDYMMPEMDGIDTLKNIKALEIPALKNVPIVALTANAVSGAREMFLEAGFDEYISKPIEIRKFEKVLKECMAPEKIVYISDKEETYEA